jgi:hypothetical protein
MWIVIGLLAAAALGFTGLRLNRLKTPLRWWEWTLGGLGISLGLFALQNYYASVVEFEPNAPARFLLVFGLPSLALFLLGIILPVSRYLVSSRRSRKTIAEPAAELK